MAYQHLEADSETTPTPKATLVCNGCPFGCVLSISLDEEGKVAHVEGNTCEKGLAHAHEVASLARELGISLAQARERLDATDPDNVSASADAVENPKTHGYRAFRKERARKRAHQG